MAFKLFSALPIWCYWLSISCLSSPFAACTALWLDNLISNAVFVYVNVSKVFCLCFYELAISLDTDVKVLACLHIVRHSSVIWNLKKKAIVFFAVTWITVDNLDFESTTAIFLLTRHQLHIVPFFVSRIMNSNLSRCLYSKAFWTLL